MSDVFSRFAVKPQPTPVEEQPASTGKAEYQAIDIEKQNRRTPARLRIVYGDGTIGLMSYAYLSEVLCTSHQFVSLVYSHCIITVEGRNLFTLVDAMQEDKVRALHCFNGKRHQEPEQGEPCITRIARQTRKEIAQASDGRSLQKDKDKAAELA